MKRSEVKKFVPRSQDAFALCEGVYGRSCRCRWKGRPCSAWRPILLDCAIHGFKDHVAAEKHRLKFNRRNGSNHSVPSNAEYKEIPA